MKNLITKRAYLAGLIAALLLVGCIVSATFVITETFTLSPMTGFYFHRVDITTDATWQDHKDQIDFIDAIGMEMYITSTEASTVTFNAYIDTLTTGAIPAAIPDSATQIINNLSIAPGKTKITYAQSLSILTGLDRLKTLAKLGKFDFFATSSGTEGTTFTVDSVTVVVTVSASK